MWPKCTHTGHKTLSKTRGVSVLPGCKKTETNQSQRVTRLNMEMSERKWRENLDQKGLSSLALGKVFPEKVIRITSCSGISIIF